MTVREFLDTVKARAEAATEGPWRNELLEIGPVDGPRVADAATEDDNPRRLFDAEFISHSRSDVPKLVAALEAVMEEHWPVSRGTICPTCDVNPDGYTMYPCPTVQAIENALGGSDVD